MIDVIDDVIMDRSSSFADSLFDLEMVGGFFFRSSDSELKNLRFWSFVW